jgi:hypothetical protein
MAGRPGKSRDGSHKQEAGCWSVIMVFCSTLILTHQIASAKACLFISGGNSDRSLRSDTYVDMEGRPGQETPDRRREAITRSDPS